MKTVSSSLDLFFQAQSIAVIGASAHKEKVGYQILNNLIQAERSVKNHNFRKLYPINPGAENILGLKTYRSMTEIDERVDLVIVVTPVGTVLNLVEEIIERNRLLPETKKVKAMIIISAGFAEIDKEGRALQHLITTKLALAQIKLLGPNTLGLIHTGHALNASFAQLQIPTGNLAVISQSGAMLTALFNALEARKAGVSFAVSLGNKADINENDCLEYALHDHHTTAVIMYIESFTHLPQFFELVSQVRRHKPVIILKGGTSARGQVASSSHTAALATNQALLQFAAKQFGFTLVENMEELMNVAFFLAHHRHLPTNTMVVTNAGGPAVNTIDALSSAEVPLAQWSPHSRASLPDLLPKSTVANPLDLLGDANAQQFKLALEVAQRDQNIDSVLIIITPQAVTDIPSIVEQLIQSKGKKPLFVSIMGGDHLEQFRAQLREHHITSTAFANDVVDMLRVLTTAGERAYLPFRYVLSQSHTPTDPNQQLKAPSLHRHLAAQQGLTAGFMVQPNLKETFTLLEKEGFTVPKYWILTADTIDEVEKISYPVFVKTGNLSIIHKKKVGAVYGVVKTPAEARTAYAAMSQFGNDVLFQEVVAIEHELLVGVENDPQFGLFLTVGLGGSYTNLLGDRSYCFLPAPKSIIERSWKKTKAYTLFKEHRELNEAILVELDRIQKLVMKYPWIRGVEVNPLAISQGKIWVADIKLQV